MYIQSGMLYRHFCIFKILILCFKCKSVNLSHSVFTDVIFSHVQFNCWVFFIEMLSLNLFSILCYRFIGWFWLIMVNSELLDKLQKSSLGTFLLLHKWNRICFLWKGKTTSAFTSYSRKCLTLSGHQAQSIKKCFFFSTDSNQKRCLFTTVLVNTYDSRHLSRLPLKMALHEFGLGPSWHAVWS